MSTEEEVVDGELVYAVVPYTGEAIVLRDATAPQLAQLLDDCREFERAQLAGFKRAIQDELIRRIDESVAAGVADSWTWHTPAGWKITADNPGRTDWPVDVLRSALQRLILDKKIDPHWLDDIIVPERFKVARKQLSNLLKVAGPNEAAALRACEQPTARPRAVRVERER